MDKAIEQHAKVLSSDLELMITLNSALPEVKELVEGDLKLKEDEEKPKGKGGAKAKAAEVKKATQAAPAAEVVQAPVEPVKSKESLGIVLDNGELIFPPKDPYE